MDVTLQASGKRNGVGLFKDVIILQVRVNSSVLQAEFPNHSFLEKSFKFTIKKFLET
jgi:hypothetical protein